MKNVFFAFIFLFGFSLFAQEQAKEEESFYSLYTRCDFFYWNTEENGLDYLYDNALQVSDNHGANGDIRRGKFTWHGGFRIAADYHFQMDRWQIEFAYANFDPRNRFENLRHEGRYLYGTFPTPSLMQIEWATTYLTLRCHFADMILKRKWDVSPHFSFTYFNGMTAAWMKQNWDVYYYDAVQDPNYLHIKPLWRFKGGGIKVGLLANWSIQYGIGIFVKFAASALYGNYDNRTNIVYYTNVGTRDVIACTHYDDFRVVTNLNFLLGPCWNWNFTKWGIDLLAAYELNSFFNVHEVHRQLIRYSGVNNNPESRHFEGVLQMQGFTAALTLRF